MSAPNEESVQQSAHNGKERKDIEGQQRQGFISFLLNQDGPNIHDDKRQEKRVQPD